MAAAQEDGSFHETAELVRRARKVALYGLLCVLLIPFVFPTWWMVTSSVKPISEIFAFPPSSLPTRLRLDAYGEVFELQPFAQQYWNTAYIAAIVTLGTMAVVVAGRLRLRPHPLPRRRTRCSWSCSPAC